MTGVSLYRDGLALDPPLSSCAGCTTAEAEIRSLLDHITNSFLNNPAKFIGIGLRKLEGGNCWEVFRHWVQKFESEADSDPRFPMCPDLKRRIEALVYRLVNERYGVKRKRETVEDVLAFLKCLAADPFDQMWEAPEGWVDEILRARTALSWKDVEVNNADDVPSRKRQKTQKFLRATNSNLGSRHLLIEPIRRSKRTLLKISQNELPRKRIPVGFFFQADVPDWTSPSNKEDLVDDTNGLDDSKWLGTQIWPLEGDDRRLGEEMIGKGRSDSCACTSPGSVECIRFHVNNTRVQLKSNLGPAFSSLGFAEMGEEVSKSWTQEEQMRFDDLVRQNSSSEGKSFWEPALKYFTSKRRQDIVSFYFNVFVLRWMSIRTRLGAWAVDSSDDENFG